MNLVQIMMRFPTEDDARNYLKRIRWPNGVRCPKCGCERISELKSRNQYTCLDKPCRYRFSVTSNTVLHSTKLDLRKWLLAICLLVNAKKSVSSHQLGRDLSISVKRAWHLNHRIRMAMAEDKAQAELFRGIVQSDDYYLGGSPRPEEKGLYKRGRGSEKKQKIVAAYCEGKIRTAAVPNLKGKTIEATIGPWLDKANTELHTDEFSAYRRIGRQCKPHKVVNHNEWYVTIDGVHTNGVENFWSLFARGVMGSFHHISRKHLPKYLAEFDSRFNARQTPTTEYFETILANADGRRLSMDMLVGKDTE